ncbi:MAG: hypothetical protein Q8O24_05430 [Gallionellaceae bacterium]|nr:hypothetical protein [Gallionellaceae bacterium]
MGRAGLQIKSGTTVHEVPIRLQSCEGVIALSDGLSMCYINERRERRCKELHKGEAVTRDAIGVTASSGFAENVVAMARGDVQTLPGQSRTKPPRIAGLPFGQVIGEGGNLVFDFSVDKHMANAERVSITDDTDNASPLWETAITSATVKFQVNSIKTDTWYRWIAQVGERKFNGRFLLVGAALDAARIELQRLEADTGLTPQAKAFLKADVLNEYGLVHERDLALGEQRGLALGHGSK